MTSPGPRPPALVLGGGVTGLGVLRALGRAGVGALLAAPPGDIAARSRWARPVPGPEPAPAPGGLAGWLEHLALPQAVLLPCNDAVALEVARLDPARAGRFPSAIAAPGVLECLVDKALFARRLAALDIPAPETWLLDGAGDLDALPDDALRDAFLKPRDSQEFFRRFGVKGFHVRDRTEAAGRVRQALDAGCSMFLQRYIPGPPDAHWFLEGYASAGGEIRGLIVRQRVRMYPADFGNSSLMEVVPVDRVRPAADALARLLAALSYRGMFSAEFKRGPDGVFRLLEVNARAWWYVGFAARAGMNAPLLAWLDAQGLPLPPPTAVTVGRACVYPYYDLHAEGRPALPAWLGLLARADQPVLAWDDPWPWVRECLGLARGAISRRLGRRGH